MVPLLLALAFLLITLLTTSGYGYFGDEMYYIICGRHLDFGYVDQPPFVAFLARLTTLLFGESILALRFVSGLAGATTVLLAAAMARRLGGGTFASGFASALILSAPGFLALSSFFSMNAPDIMLSTLLLYLFLTMRENPPAGRWIIVGLIGGIGLLNKYTFLVLGFSLVVSLVITARWSILKSPWLYVSGAVSLLMLLPHLLWQAQHGWPTAEFMKNATEFKNLSLSPVEFFLQLAFLLNPLTVPFWAGGLLVLLRGEATTRNRYLGWTALIFLGVYLLQNSKTYYVLPVFPLLLSAGAVGVESLARRLNANWAKPVIVGLVTLSGLVLLPIAVPILPVDNLVQYSKGLGLWDAVRMETGEGDRLPLHIVHRIGWEELVGGVGRAYAALPEKDREECAILASWYGPAGAVDIFGDQYGLPKSICPRNNYWLWGPREYSGDVVLAIGYSEQSLRHYFAQVEEVAHFRHPYAYDQYVFLCRKSRTSLRELWPRLKVFS